MVFALVDAVPDPSRRPADSRVWYRRPALFLECHAVRTGLNHSLTLVCLNCIFEIVTVGMSIDLSGRE